MNLKNLDIIFVLFLFVFQPPFIPIALIYILGPIILFLLWKKNEKKLIHRIAKESKIQEMWHFYILLAIYLLIINVLDTVIVGNQDIIEARLRGFNQLIILSGFQFLFILYVILYAGKNQFNLDDIFRILFFAALLEGIFVVIAYLLPSARFLFVTFGQQKLFSNEYFIEKRGFGFAQNLIDTFGYGIGLIAGYILLYEGKQKINLIFKVSLFLLLVFSTAVNSRTGLMIILIALIIKYLYAKSFIMFSVKLVILLLLGGVIVAYLENILNAGLNSGNATVEWVSSAFDQMLHFFSNDSKTSFDDLTFTSDVVELPSNSFELLFGSGHWIYDTRDQLGFRTDIGWYNLFWEFGILGTLVLMCGMTYYMIKPYFISNSKSIKMISIFNVTSYYLVLVKAILLGSNPGTFVAFFSTFCLHYYLKKEKIKNSIYGLQTK